MYIDQNIDLLKKKFPYLEWDILRGIENDDNNRADIEATRGGHNTIKISINNSVSYLHSKYDPLAEAKMIVDSLKLKPEDHHLLFYGIGLGYVLDAIKEKKSNITYSIYEPDPLVFKRFLSSQRLSYEFVEALTDIYINGLDKKERELFVFFRKLDYRIKQVTLPSYERVYKENYIEFCCKLKNSIIDKRFNVETRYVLEKLWMKNMMKNFPYTIKSGNILNLSEKIFRSKPAIIVSSGPSLDEEIENLRKIKEGGFAYIFTAGSSIYKLLKHGIFPDAVCAIDASDMNYDVYRTLFEDPQNDVPLIYADMMFNKVVSDYNAKLFSIITEEDPLAAYYLKYKQNMKVEKVKNAPSVAIVTLQVLHKLHCDPIVLVGQNLALKNDYYYAKGIDYHKYRQAKEKITESDRVNTFPVEDVNGHMIYTIRDLDMMRRNMEVVINHYSINNIINTTKGGAKISGTKYMPLSDLIEERLNIPVVDPHWYESEAESYDLEYVKERHKLMLEEHKAIGATIKRIEKEIGKIKKAVLKNNENKLNLLLFDFSRIIKELTRNKFFETFVFPMNSLQVDLIANSLAGIARETDTIKKGEKAVKEFRDFIDDVKDQIKEIEPYFQEFSEKIQSYDCLN